jgi:hypothetical protein
MQTHIFINEKTGWYIDLPEYIDQGGSKADLQMVEGADTMLDIMANGNAEVSIVLDTKPFDGADELTLLELCDPEIGGGFYLMHTYKGKEIMHRMWLCGVALFVFGFMPEKIFIKQVS